MKKEAQLTLPFSLSEETLKAHLQKATGKKVSLRLTDNSTSMISSRTRDGVLHVRLHRMFLLSDAGLVDEIAAFIGRRRTKTPLLRSFIRQNSGLLRRCEPRQPSINPQGRHHDLASLAESVNREYFGGRINAPSTWGIRRRGRAVRRRTLGSYSSHTNTIRINPVLDKKMVPPYFIEFIIYHEMLHADMGVGNDKDRRLVHSREFRQREKLFRKYAEALAWEKGMNFLL
jgi:predicted metal-dependent hydrolase